ncbi:MAG: hypothetical protein Q8P32_00535 [Candidatus Komeilibacteria bacterium]|nr:hypothetical protein [Candidatus Komeilibacteria bacterium]
MQQNIKRNLNRALALFGLIAVAMVALTIWNNQTGILDRIAQKYF